MVDSADRFTCLTRCQEWLKFEGFRADSWKQLGQVWSRDETRNPDRLPGARLVVFAGQEGVSNPAGFSSRCDGVFSELQKYFSKKHRSIGSAKSYLAFILVPLASPNEELARFAGTFRPALSSFSGSYVPILVDLSQGALFYHRRKTGQAASGPNKLTDEIDWLFLPPISKHYEIDSSITTLVNGLRGVPLQPQTPPGTRPANLSLSDVKKVACQLYYQANTQAHPASARELLFAYYLIEYLRAVESQSARPISKLNDTLNLGSFTSLDQFSQDIAESLARTMASGFRKGFEGALRDGVSEAQRRKLVKNPNIISLAYCPQCRQVVRLATTGGCPNGVFHTVDPAAYFAVDEEQAIQEYSRKQRKK